MKLAILRRASTGGNANWTAVGALLGIVAAFATIGVAGLGSDLGTVLDLLAVVLAIWTLGWMVAPAWVGDSALRAEHFALLPIPKPTLAVGLLGAAFVGITTAVTLVAFLSLVVFAARLGGVLPVVVAVPATLVQLTLVVLLSRLTARMFGALSRSRSGAVISGVITAVMIVVASSGWIIFVGVEVVLATGFSPGFSAVVRALPSSWGLVAIEAAARRDWGVAALALLGLVALAGVLLLAWSRLLGPPRLGRPAVRGTANLPAQAIGGTRSVYAKEMRTWCRSPGRVQILVAAPVFAVLSCLVPLAFGSSAMLPFAGALTALMGAAMSANLYGEDGTALWLTLVTPGAEADDVRGRQLAWLTLFAPAAVLFSILGTVLSGQYGLWPWASAATTAVLGAGVALVPLIGLTQLAPGPDPHRDRYSPMDRGDAVGGAFATLVAALVLTIPALVPVAIGAAMGSDEIQVLGVAVGVITSLFYWTALGGLAVRKLADRGPELLYLMRAGKEARERAAADASVFAAMPKTRRRLLWGSFGVGCIALFPQALVPTVMKLTGDIAKVWFLALHLPEPWQWPTIAMMALIAAVAFTIAVRVFLSERAKLRRARSREEQGSVSDKQGLAV
ncbi:hypothetical protein ACTG9Q_12365 [Actinokineospora sp. 24-640]